jgi:hypothetical protein
LILAGDLWGAEARFGGGAQGYKYTTDALFSDYKWVGIQGFDLLQFSRADLMAVLFEI